MGVVAVVTAAVVSVGDVTVVSDTVVRVGVVAVVPEKCKKDLCNSSFEKNCHI